MRTIRARNLGKIVPIALLVIIGATGCCCQSTKTGTSAAVPATPAAAPSGQVVVINTMCPIGGDDFAEKTRPVSLAREWKGQEIGFCCEHCVAKFNRMTDGERDAVLQTAMANRAPQ